jgi:hypothetical protein
MNTHQYLALALHITHDQSQVFFVITITGV